MVEQKSDGKKALPPKRKRGGQPGNKNAKGRPRGATNKISRDIKKACLDSGEAPLAFAMRVMHAKVGQQVNGHKITWEDIKWGCTVAMPRLHPPAQPTQAPDHVTIVVQLDAKQVAGMNDAELAQLESNLTRLQQGDFDSEGQTVHTGNAERYARAIYH